MLNLKRVLNFLFLIQYFVLVKNGWFCCMTHSIVFMCECVSCRKWSALVCSPLWADSDLSVKERVHHGMPQTEFAFGWLQCFLNPYRWFRIAIPEGLPSSVWICPLFGLILGPCVKVYHCCLRISWREQGTGFHHSFPFFLSPPPFGTPFWDHSMLPLLYGLLKGLYGLLFRESIWYFVCKMYLATHFKVSVACYVAFLYHLINCF